MIYTKQNVQKLIDSLVAVISRVCSLTMAETSPDSDTVLRTTHTSIGGSASDTRGGTVNVTPESIKDT